jgi:hypothetical protein
MGPAAAELGEVRGLGFEDVGRHPGDVPAPTARPGAQRRHRCSERSVIERAPRRTNEADLAIRFGIVERPVIGGRGLARRPEIGGAAACQLLDHVEGDLPGEFGLVDRRRVARGVRRQLLERLLGAAAAPGPAGPVEGDGEDALRARLDRDGDRAQRQASQVSPGSSATTIASVAAASSSGVPARIGKVP